MTLQHKTESIVKSTNEWIRLNAHRMYWVESNIAPFVIGQCKSMIKGVPGFTAWGSLKFIKQTTIEVNVDWDVVAVSKIRISAPHGTRDAGSAAVLNDHFSKAISLLPIGGRLNTPYDKLKEYTEYLASKINADRMQGDLTKDKPIDLMLNLERLEQFEFTT